MSAPVNHGKADKPPGCPKVFTRLEFRQAVRESLKRPPFTAGERKRVKHRKRCRATQTRYVARRMHIHLVKAKRAYRRRQAVARVTPYAGPRGTRWAIPYPIVQCESRGSWSAYNPSGAMGPYQLLGKGAPWPANTAARRLTHHRIAFRLYAGGAGRSHWVC